MVRFLVRLCLTPLAIVLVDAAILIPFIIALLEVVIALRSSSDLHEPMDILEGMGVIFIGWGVALEERHTLRQIFGLSEGDDELFQGALDDLCHASGLGFLIFGLFAEMCVEAVRLPNHIINTDRLDPYVIMASLGFLVLAMYVMVRHIVLVLKLMLLGPAAVPRQHGSH